ncbi:hypothetical protein A3L11_02315 [Thermococcus siculi]|uniref:Uncharacterized protein n=1 Tax=Thermococcus siculi TaxID=72803 RepID=A0A2Z2ML32_9EURY|nr:hypothetical protein [Thermococcus siculi]ASJ08121.1 hypothetical protein A3L11_02315 [Thermococcus siculi]
MSEAINPYMILQKIDEIERELEDLRAMLLKMVSEEPDEEIDEDTLKEFEKDLKDMIEGKVETVSGDEAIKILSESLKN